MQKLLPKKLLKNLFLKISQNSQENILLVNSRISTSKINEKV